MTVKEKPLFKNADGPGSTAEKGSGIRTMNALKIFFFVFLFGTIFTMIYCSLADKAGVMETDEVTYIDRWTVTDDTGKQFETGKYYIGDHRYEGWYSIECTLPDNLSDSSWICFAVYESTSVYIDGQLRKDFDDRRDVPFTGGIAAGFYMTIPLNSGDSGKQLKMNRISFSDHPEVVPETFISGYGGIYTVMFDKYGVWFSIAAMLLIFSIVVILLGLGMLIRYRHPIGMIYGAVGVFVISLWLVTNSYLYPFVLGHYHVNGVVNYMCCLMLPFGLDMYLDFLQNGRYRRAHTVIMLLSAVNAVFWTTLHFAGILNFRDALVYIDIILALLIIGGVVVLLLDFKDGNMPLYRYTAIGFLGFLFFGLIEIVLLFSTGSDLKQDDIPMLLGVTFFLIFVVLQQIDDLRKVSIEKQRALDISDAKTKFLANMSHEIRTPINSILGMNEMILRENKDKVIDKYAQNVKSSGKMLSMLVNDILDFSKIEAGKLEITNTEFRLSRLISDIITMFSDRIAMKKLNLETVIGKNVPDGMFGDEIRIKQILVNLLSNAIKYTDAGSITITIGGFFTTDSTFDLSLTVKDTGRGIRKEDIDGLFDAFSRADINKNRNIEGTGLGLAIVKSILDSMDGEITVESEYGKGSSFIVSIPVNVTDRSPVRLDPISNDHHPSKEYKCDYTAPDARVLAVDDNHSNLTIVKLFLKATGIKPDLCSNGSDAINMCKTYKYDLILLDHMMPSPDGIETLYALRNDDDSLNRDTPALVLTANAIAGSRQKYLDVGFNDYLTKPLDAAELERTVKKFLPPDKIISLERTASAQAPAEDINDEFYVEEFLPVEDDPQHENDNTAGGDGPSSIPGLKERLSSIEGFDYDVAYLHCGGDESILKEIMMDVASEGVARVDRMRRYLDEKDYSSYCIEAHAIKGLMATIGLDELSNTARKHEFAARGRDEVFVRKDGEAFIDSYEEV
ncbi:MAG: response regulator, partial [Lachnospiraceae bacterium]|nr:response regulator [Lachnospiraceae bacterium]